jgi:sugar phosphate isomerase/epimerase
MKHMKIGIRLECLGLPLRRAIDEAARMGAAGVQFDAVGELSPERLSDTGRRELKNLLRARGLELTALGCPLRRGLDVTEDQQPRLEFVRKVMNFAFEMGPRTVILSAGQVPEKEDEPRAGVLRESLSNLSRYGDHMGTRVALETGLESGEALAAYLATYHAESLGANLVPGNLLLHGFNPMAAARALAGRIFHVHARDGRRSSTSRAAREAALGAGDIDWLAYLETLEELEYRGYLVVVRDEGERRAAEIEAGVKFLKRLMG